MTSIEFVTGKLPRAVVAAVDVAVAPGVDVAA
jgi:hypothetical protein